MPTHDEDNPIRKAAVLIRSLDGEAAAAVLARLSAEEARALRAAVREVGEVTDDDRQSIADELRSPVVHTAKASGGVELSLGGPVDAPPLAGAYGRSGPAPQLSKREDPLAFLRDAEVGTVAAFLERESAQTKAVVLSCLPPDRAAGVLAELPGDEQVAVLDRLAELGDTDADSLSVITEDLRAWIETHQRSRDRRSQREEAVAAILSAATESDRRRLLADAGDRSWGRTLAAAKTTKQDAAVESSARQTAVPDEQRDPMNGVTVREAPPSAPPDGPAANGWLPPATVNEPPVCSFEDVERFPVAALAQVMRHAPAESLLLALAGGSERLMQRLAGALPRRQAALLRRRISTLGPTRLRDIEHAQQSIARVASDLLRSGRIRVPAGARRTPVS